MEYLTWDIGIEQVKGQWEQGLKAEEISLLACKFLCASGEMKAPPGTPLFPAEAEGCSGSLPTDGVAPPAQFKLLLKLLRPCAAQDSRERNLCYVPLFMTTLDHTLAFKACTIRFTPVDSGKSSEEKE